MLLFFIALSFSLCLSISKTFHFSLSNYISFAITKSFSLLRFLWALSLFFFPCALLLSNIFFGISNFLLLLPVVSALLFHFPDSSMFFCFLFYSDWSLNFEAWFPLLPPLHILHQLFLVRSSYLLRSLPWFCWHSVLFFHLVLLSSVFLFPQYHLLLLSGLSMCAWNSSLRFASSYHTSVSLWNVCSYSSTILWFSLSGL